MLVLSNEWLALQSVESLDAGELFVALNSDLSWEHVAGRPGSVAEWEQLIANRQADPSWHTFCIRLQQPLGELAAGEVVGTSSYLDIVVSDERLEIGSTVYRPEAWGTWVNPAAKLLLLEYAFESLQVGRVQLKTDIRNLRSQAAISKLGARQEGVLRRYQRRADGSMRDTVMFSILADEWPKARQALHERLSGR